jgi:hypothetical protein
MTQIKWIVPALAMGALLCGAARADDLGAPLSADQIKQQLINKKEWFVGTDGKTWGGIYNQDGSYVYGSGNTGTWRLDGDRFCNKPDGGDENCGTIHQLDAKSYQFIRADGSKGVIIKLP